MPINHVTTTLLEEHWCCSCKPFVIFKNMNPNHRWLDANIQSGPTFFLCLLAARFKRGNNISHSHIFIFLNRHFVLARLASWSCGIDSIYFRWPRDRMKALKRLRQREWKEKWVAQLVTAHVSRCLCLSSSTTGPCFRELSVHPRHHWYTLLFTRPLGNMTLRSHRTIFFLCHRGHVVAGVYLFV